MNTTVIATFRVHGFHAWPRAPREVAYLSSRHRHEFHFRVEVEVTDPDREVEFHTLQRASLAVLAEAYPGAVVPGEYEFGPSSCEHIATSLLNKMVKVGHPVSAVECWEDGENGARVAL
jgi:hypothetical protein